MRAAPRRFRAPAAPPVGPDALLAWLVSGRARLIRMLRRCGYTEADSEDAVQEAALATLERLRVRDTCVVRNPAAWLRRVARNRAATHTRRRSRYRRLEIDPVAPMGLPLECDLDWRDRREQAMRAVRALPPDIQALLLLRAEGHSYRVLGELVDWSESRVRRLLARVLCRLRAELNGK